MRRAGNLNVACCAQNPGGADGAAARELPAPADAIRSARGPAGAGASDSSGRVQVQEREPEHHGQVARVRATAPQASAWASGPQAHTRVAEIDYATAPGFTWLADAAQAQARLQCRLGAVRLKGLYAKASQSCPLSQ